MRFILVLSLTGLFSGCASIGNSEARKPSENVADVSSSITIEELAEPTEDELFIKTSSDIFRAGDTVNVLFYGIEDLDGSFTVDRSGFVQFPLVGQVEAQGKTTRELQDKLVELYGDKYLQNPSVSVSREALELGRVVVDGAVRKPGAFPVNEIISLSEAIALAEGLDEDANDKNVLIVRSINGNRQVASVDLRAIRYEGAEDPRIYPRDTIFIQDSRGRAAFREFLRTVPLLSTAAILTRR